MPGPTRWDQRFFASTRGRIVTLLRRASLTVEELADALDLTDNAIRAHLATLERDGLVQQRGVRRGGSKPAHAYALAPEAEALFPKAYAELLRQTLGQVAARHGRAEVEAVLRAVGRDLAASLGGQRPGATLEERLEGIQQVLASLGGLAEVRREEGHLLLQGCSCPLGAIVPDHPEACQLALVLIQSLLGTEAVHERCVHGPEPRCAFEVEGEA